MGIRRITSTVGTVPNYTALVGTVTSNTDTTVLSYAGSNDIADIFQGGKLGENSTMWIYVPAGTPKISKVVGVYKNATNDWSIFLETGMTGASASACAYINAAITYSFTNDGGASITVDGVTLEDGEGDAKIPYAQYSNRPKFHKPVYVDASGSSVLISEET